MWFFEDRLEVTSPGGLIPDLTLAELLRLERRHMSRNPRLVRALVDLGIMRDQGEGIPRMFAEMEGLFLPAPTIETRPAEFALTLRNTPTLSDEDKAFVASLGMTDFALAMKAKVEGLMIDRMDQNQEIVTRYLNDAQFQDVAFRLLVRRIYDEVRAQAP